MYRSLFIIQLLLLPLFAFSGDLVRYPESKISLQDRLQWGFETADKAARSAKNHFWIGYSVKRFTYPDELFLSGVSFSGEIRFDTKKPTLQEWVNGVKVVPKHEVSEQAKTELSRLEKSKAGKVWKEVGIFQRFQADNRNPDKTAVIDMSVPHNFDERLYWLGNVSSEESFGYLSTQYKQIQRANEKEDLLAAIGIHPPALAFPFFKKILTGTEPEEAQESAAIFTGELDTPEALELLKSVAQTNQWKSVRENAVVGIAEMDSAESLKVLTQLALSSPDKDLRETAMAMLSDKDDPQALTTLEKVAWFDSDSEMRETAVVMLAESEQSVPALLKIMEQHPSKETREIALRMLAESVAGRQILKKKVKQ